MQPLATLPPFLKLLSTGVLVQGDGEGGTTVAFRATGIPPALHAWGDQEA